MNDKTSGGASSASGVTYRDAGVDVDAGNRFVDLIRAAVASTRRPEVRSDIGGFGALFMPDFSRYREPVLVAGTDGVGTKLKLAFLMNRHDTVGIDLVAMSVNDLVVQGAEPLFFLDYFATGKLHPEAAAQVVEGIAAGCRQAGCALIGGETAEMPGFYAAGEYDLAGFAVGIVERSEVIDGSRIHPGDVLVGLGSSGPHSNGYSLIRRLVLEPGGPGLDAPFAGGTLGDALLTPTRIYVRTVLDLARRFDIKGVVHITGGGFQDNIPRVLPEGVVAEVQVQAWPRPEWATLLAHLGQVAPEEMLRTFNCGIGMVLVVPASQAQAVLTQAVVSGERAWIIGTVREREQHEPQVSFRD
ncbi:MAG: phosphoribosylformylglycinamidine cyclo-ligase [Magnetococcus sp. WYHC-3]